MKKQKNYLEKINKILIFITVIAILLLIYKFLQILTFNFKL